MHALKKNAAGSYRPLLNCNLSLRNQISYNHPARAFATSFAWQYDNRPRPPKITWYEQLYPGAPGKRRLVDESGAPALSDVSQELHQRVAALEKEIKELRDGQEHSSKPSESLIEPLLEQLSEEDRHKVRLALEKAELSDAEEAEVEAESEALARKAVGKLAGGHGAEILQDVEFEELEDSLDLEASQIPPFRRFTTCLSLAADNSSNHKAQKDLWISYERCKRLIPTITHHLPDECWQILWNNQHSSTRRSRDRAPHLSIIAQDMLQSGKELSTQQRGTIIETLLDEGRLAEAQAQWDSQGVPSSKTDATTHQLLGVRLFVARGDLVKAQHLAEQVFLSEEADTARCLIPVIEGWAKQGTETSVRNAWTCYLSLRGKLGDKIQTGDFDRVAMCFININRADVAMAVFKDMMLTGRESDFGSDQLYKTSLTLIGLLQSRSASPAEVSSVSLEALTTLPRRFQNKFFYGSWIKKLIGLGEVEGAVSVVELMYERGVTPDAKHVNGIIGAWLRGGHAAHKEKAEQLGWAMIQQRLRVVQQRRGADFDPPSNEDDHTRIRVQNHIRRVVPPATIETFSLLLQYYERRSNADAVLNLKKHLDLAEVPPNTYFINHMLYAELRRGQHAVAWRMYQKMTSFVKPDLETFACLWDCEKAHLDRLTMNPTDVFPGPRAIFHDFVRWFEGVDKRTRLNVLEDFSEELYNQIMRCMCLAKDIEGTLVALYGLKKSFGLLPNDETLRLISMQVARIGLEEATMTRKRRRSRLSEIAGSKARIANVSKVFDLVVEQRIEALERHGIKLEECSVQRQNEEQVHVLSEFLRVIMKRSTRNEQAMDDAITKAAEEMGVSGIELSDPLQSLRA